MMPSISPSSVLPLLLLMYGKVICVAWRFMHIISHSTIYLYEISLKTGYYFPYKHLQCVSLQFRNGGGSGDCDQSTVYEVFKKLNEKEKEKKKEKENSMACSRLLSRC